LWKAVQDEVNPGSPVQLVEAAIPTGRLGRALLHLADRLSRVSASCEMADGSITLNFDDGEDGLRISRRSRDLARRVRTLGVQGAADQLAEEYLRLNSARRSVLDAVKVAASRLGWCVERRGPFFLAPGISAVWYLGRTRREVELPVGRVLTDTLWTATPEQAIRHLFASHCSFAEACVTGLGDRGTLPTLPQRDLATALPTRQPRLRTLDPGTMAEMVAFADRTLADHLQNSRTIWNYLESARFDPAYDTWAATADWVRLAERLIDGDWPNPAGVLALLDAGNPRGADRARQMLARMQPHNEASKADDQPQAFKATGTNASTNATTAPWERSHAVSGRYESHPDVMAVSDDDSSTNEKTLVSKGFDACCRSGSCSDMNAPRRTRTFNPLIKSQLLCQLS